MVKLANNFVLGCAIESIAEAFSLVAKYGYRLETLHQVLTDGLFGGSPAYDGYGSAMVEERYEQGMRARLALKDVDLILAAAAVAGVRLPSAQVNRDTLTGTVEHGDLDWAGVARERARAAGLTNLYEAHRTSDDRGETPGIGVDDDRSA